MGHHKLYVGGVEYPWSYLKYKRSFSVIAQPFVAHIPNLESFTPGDTVEIKRDAVSVAKGLLAMGSWQTDKDVLTILNCFDYRRKFQLLKGVFTAPISEAAAHLRAQLINTDLVEGTFNNYGTITVDYGASANAYFDRRRIAEDITFMTGWEFKSTPAGSCNFKAQCGSDLSATIRFSREEGTLRGWEVDYVQNGLQKVNKVTVIGEGLGAYQAYGSAQVGGYVAGDPETTINRKSLVNNTLCTSAAVALLADMQNVIKYGVARVINVNDGLAFDVFDTINIRDEKLEIDEDLRVAGITVEAWADAGEITQVEVCNIAHLQTSGETLIGDVRGRVEDDYSRATEVIGADSCQPGLGTISAPGRDSYDKNVTYVEVTSLIYVEVFLLEHESCPINTKLQIINFGFMIGIDGDAYVKISYKFGADAWVEWIEAGPYSGADETDYDLIIYHGTIGFEPTGEYGETVQIKLEVLVSNAGDVARVHSPFFDYLGESKREDLA